MCSGKEALQDQDSLGSLSQHETAEFPSVLMPGEHMPCVYINHGGGPLPILGQQPDVANFLRSYPSTLPQRPRAILVVTAHWEGSCTAVSGGASHPLLFDYGGFPPESYKYSYPAPGNPALAQRVRDLLGEAGLPCSIDTRRGWDHGVFVPLMLMFPDADIPVVALGLQKNQDPAAHVAVGLALQRLRDEGVLIIGSGASFHNFSYFFAKGKQRAVGEEHSAVFDKWLNETVTEQNIPDNDRRSRMEAVAAAPSFLEAHPPGAAEHLMPLFVVFGASGAGPPGKSVGEPTKGIRFSQFEFP